MRWLTPVLAGILCLSCGGDNEGTDAPPAAYRGFQGPPGGFQAGTGGTTDAPDPVDESDGTDGDGEVPVSAPGNDPTDKPTVPLPEPITGDDEEKDPPPPQDPPKDPPPPQDPPDDPPPPEDPPPPPPSDPADPPEGGCYYELYYPDASVADLKASYNSGKWLATSLEVLKRRYPAGHWLLNEMKNDPWLGSYVWGSDFGSLMDSLGTMCHEETHGWDYDTALDMYPNHAFYNTPELKWYPPKFPTFPRSEILKYIVDDSTSLYDGTYLTGSMGSYEWYDHADEINAYINGLGCNTPVAEQIPYGVSARDGAAGALLYLVLYLKVARLDHPSVWSKIQANHEWMGFIRYAWARGHYWLKQSEGMSSLDIDAASIMKHVNKPANYQEIEHLTGQTAQYVACYPQDFD